MGERWRELYFRETGGGSRVRALPDTGPRFPNADLPPANLLD